MTLPSDLLIFSPSTVHQPLEVTPLRQRQPGGHQEGRPVDRVEADDVLADECTSAGQKRQRAAPARPGKPQAVT